MNKRITKNKRRKQSWNKDYEIQWIDPQGEEVGVSQCTVRSGEWDKKYRCSEKGWDLR